MRHRKAGFKLKRNVSARRALLRGLVTSVIEEERITTTVPKAKATRPLVEKMITLAKKDTPHTRMQAASFLLRSGAVEKLFEKLGPRFNQRNGGYRRRRGNGQAGTGWFGTGQAGGGARRAPGRKAEAIKRRPGRRRGAGRRNEVNKSKKEQKARKRTKLLGLFSFCGNQECQ
jgi:large subunit ribosomal protein L17